MKYNYSLNGKPIFFFGSETIKETAGFFSEILKREDKEYNVIEDESNIQIGWGFYTVHQVGSEYQIMARDLLGDPFEEVAEDLSLSLEIFAQQRKMFMLTRVIPKETTFQDTLIVQKAALKASEIYLVRNEPANPSDSGWYMGCLGGKVSNNPGDHELIYTYELLKFCKEALAAIQLPIGTMCIIKNGKLIEIVDKNNYKIF